MDHPILSFWEFTGTVTWLCLVLARTTVVVRAWRCHGSGMADCPAAPRFRSISVTGVPVQSPTDPRLGFWAWVVRSGGGSCMSVQRRIQVG